MALPNLPRVQQKVFGDVSSPINNFIQFGSLAAGAVQYTKDLALIQALAAYDIGWAGAVVGNKSPSLEDMNGLFFLAFKQMAYLFQKGVPEWNADTNYYTGHLCSSGGVIYRSKVENNLNNPVSDTNSWIEYVKSVLTLPAITLEKTYLFPNMQYMGSFTGNTGWQNLDVGPVIASAGLGTITPTAVIMRAMVRFGKTSFSNSTFEATLKVRGDTSSDLGSLVARTFGGTDDSATAGEDNATGPVPLNNGTIVQYNQSNVNWTANGELYVVGFIYNQVVQL